MIHLASLQFALIGVGLLLSTYRLGGEMAHVEHVRPRTRFLWVLVPVALGTVASGLLEAGQNLGRCASCC